MNKIKSSLIHTLLISDKKEWMRLVKKGHRSNIVKKILNLERYPKFKDEKDEKGLECPWECGLVFKKKEENAQHFG